MTRNRWLHHALSVAIAIVMISATAKAADEAIAATGSPLNVAIFINSSKTYCYSSGHVLATRKLANLAAEQINARGGVRGRPIRLNIYDNKSSEKRALSNAKAAVKLDSLIAMIGFDRQNYAKRVFDEIASMEIQGPDGKAIPASTIPIITNVEKTWAREHHRNVFSTKPNQETERVPAMVEYFAGNGIGRIGFLGRTNVSWAAAIGQKLEKQMPAGAIVSDQRLDIGPKPKPAHANEKWLNPAQLTTAVANIKLDLPQMLVVSVGTSYTRQVLEELQRQGVNNLPIFMVGWLNKQIYPIKQRYQAPVYGIDWASVPEVENDRLFNVLSVGSPEDWLFADREVASASQWAERKCGETFKHYVPSTYSMRNIAAARFGALFADMIKLVAASAGKTGETLDTGRSRDGKTTPIQRYRAAIRKDLAETYVLGRGAFKGLFENWYFRADEQIRSVTPLIVILPHTTGRKQLAPSQVIRLPSRKLKAIEALYLDVDLIRIFNVDNNQKSFFAEFYLAMRRSAKAPPNEITLDDITFANAFLDPRVKNGRELTIDTLHEGGTSDIYPAAMRLYKVSGRFRFAPDYSDYPFDKQQFSIDLQPRRGDKTFIIQPPPPTLRDRVATSEGWIPRKQYVSYVEDFVPMVDAFTHRRSVAPVYNTRFVWQMERETTDYYIRVIVPLLFILIVAYLSIFIPKTNLEAIVTIQITALLAAVALYLSLPQIDTDSATISDRIFMFYYMMVSLMIVVSILRINARVIARPWFNQLLLFMHVVMLPFVFFGLLLYITKSDLLVAFMNMPGWKLLGIG